MEYNRLLQNQKVIYEFPLSHSFTNLQTESQTVTKFSKIKERVITNHFKNKTKEIVITKSLQEKQ